MCTCASASAPTAVRRSTSDRDLERLRAPPEDDLRAGDPPAPEGRARADLDDAGPAPLEDHAEHGRGRGEDRREAARQRDRGADDDRRPEGADPPGPEVDR